MDREYQLEIVPGVKGEPFFKTREEYEQFRISWREEITPALRELDRLRIEGFNELVRRIVY